MRTNRPERLRTFDYLGVHRYFLTFCTFQRRPVFVDAASVSLVSMHILRAARDEQFTVVAYCFMPDHVHLLVEGLSDASDGRRFIRLSKQLSGFHFQRAFGHRLWQRYGYERTLRDDEASLGVARYIVENPVRARLTERVADYPFVGSETYTLEAILDAVQLGPAQAGRYG